MVRSRTRAQAERTRATRARIIAAATPLFVRDGYLETTMSGIAKAAGVAVQTLYLSFGSKVAVLEAALDAAADEATAADRPAATDGPLTPAPTTGLRLGPAASKPAAITVTRTSSPSESSITVPKMMLASGCAES